MSEPKARNCPGNLVTNKQKHVIYNGRTFDFNCASCVRHEPWKTPETNWLAPAMRKGKCSNKLEVVKS